ncbi:MAG: tRNA (adenosine(37)-N6)-threonylcarbamoyltransferase complex transferase subunit TsaD [Acholeplasmatales bacterium]|nr:MAG: tRNA (adenosine(37)-N6)-threonylcarbamoyltransferase complex transferase subunit TsaD [Acholeplasmatales bacterium]
MIVLAVETSCDETSVSVTQNGETILSNIVLSQIDIHQAFGGVVPEIASREHVKGITIVFKEALESAGIKAEDVDLVAVTQGPGLIGSLLIGINAAKAFAFAHQKPLVGVHHIAGHIYANRLVGPMQFPLVCLVVSGGHTELILMRGHYQFEKLGETQDDAVGEAYDKVARVLGLGYPGGPEIDALAATASPDIPMPVSMMDGYDFSYSGLKSHVINLLNQKRMKGEAIDVARLSASFQHAAIEQLIIKSRAAVDAYGAKMFMVAGGVAANKHLRQRVERTFTDVALRIPPFAYCTDNAAMIGIAAHYQVQAGHSTESYALKGHSRLKLTP